MNLQGHWIDRGDLVILEDDSRHTWPFEYLEAEYEHGYNKIKKHYPRFSCDCEAK